MPYFYRNNIKYSGGSDSVDLTMAEYKELEANGKVVQDITYYIIDADENIPSRPNLLINSNFANPVNQRGVATLEKGTGNAQYFIDRWCVWALPNATFTVEDGFVRVSAPSGAESEFSQKVEFPEKYKGKTLTFSVKVRASGAVPSKMYIHTGTIQGLKEIPATDEWVEISTTVTVPSDATQLITRFVVNNGAQLDIEWAKLELGNYATPYVPRLYAEELQLCQRYYNQIMSTDDSNNWISRTSINGYSLGPTVEFPVEMRVPPTVKIYSNKTGVQGNIVSWHDDGDYGRGNFTAASISCKGFYIVNAEAVTEIGRWYTFNYTADAEL